MYTILFPPIYLISFPFPFIPVKQSPFPFIPIPIPIWTWTVSVTQMVGLIHRNPNNAHAWNSEGRVTFVYWSEVAMMCTLMTVLLWHNRTFTLCTPLEWFSRCVGEGRGWAEAGKCRTWDSATNKVKKCWHNTTFASRQYLSAKIRRCWRWISNSSNNDDNNSVCIFLWFYLKTNIQLPPVQGFLFKDIWYFLSSFRPEAIISLQKWDVLPFPLPPLPISFFPLREPTA